MAAAGLSSTGGGPLPEITAGGADLQDSRHARDPRKHETA